ncbi:histidinol-phosphate transaminase [Burkholderia cepacia]|uniref:histidinol-phosphate transaminase n=1 Tax=Burkholderia cepacia TaxID=292 RepID=UPI0021AB4A3E|nr:histidinol-phosphate transaminase [Burkholderia cepacia]
MGVLPAFRLNRIRRTQGGALFFRSAVCHDAAHDDSKHHALAAPSPRTPPVAPWFVSHLAIASGECPIKTTTKAPAAPFLFFAALKTCCADLSIPYGVFSMQQPWKEIALSDLPLREDLRLQHAYGAPQLDVPVCLNVNENPYPPSPALVERIATAVADAARAANRYPDRDFAGLRSHLAAYLTHDTGVTVDAAGIWAANGSNEVIQQILQAFGGPGRSALAFTPAYPMYDEYCRTTFTRLHTLPRTGDFALDVDQALDGIRAHQPGVVLLTSPNNPTGTALPVGDIRAILDVAPGVVVVDEAYAEFRRRGVPSAVTLLPDHPRLIVTRTLSKAFKFAGGRVGYCACAPAIVQALKLVRLPYHLSAFTQAAACAALVARDEMLSQVETIKAERDSTVGWLRGLGLTVADSDANFVMFGEFADRHRIWSGLLRHGVLIRESGPPAYLRVSIGTAAEMAAFRAALLDVMAAG